MSFKRLDYSEPAVLRGIVTAVVALLASVGFVNTDAISGAAEVWIPIVATAIPIVQSLWTRFATFSPKTVDAIGKHAAPEV